LAGIIAEGNNNQQQQLTSPADRTIDHHKKEESGICLNCLFVDVSVGIHFHL
jgi:hypothetical protein